MTNDTTARAEHTPTPWRAQRRDKDGVAIIAERRDIPPGGTPTNGLVAYATRRFSEPKEIWEANAAFIVRACNSHEAMRAALKMARKYVKRSIEVHNEGAEMHTNSGKKCANTWTVSRRSHLFRFRPTGQKSSATN